VDIFKKLDALHERIEPLIQTQIEDQENVEGEYENSLTQELLERFVDGLLTVLSEVELEGQIPEIETPEQAREAILAVVRRLYTKKSVVAKMSRKFARFGAKRFLRKQKTVLSKAVVK
jgi:hypothetical protein